MHENLSLAIEVILQSFREGGKLLLCGNGGSAADCQHILGELVKGFLKRRPLDSSLLERLDEDWAKSLQGGLPAIDLTANGALISAVANDIDPASVYAQQVVAYGKPGDVLMGISTSGNAENVRRALATARALGLKTIGLTGQSGGRVRPHCDVLLNVPETETYRVQERHLPLYHALCAGVESALFPE